MTADLADLFPLPFDPWLSDIPDTLIRVACTKCDAGWQYDRDERVRTLGDIPVKRFLWLTISGCSRRESEEDPCGARVVG